MDDKLLLLGLLRQQEMHGYQLYEFIERDLAVCTNLKKPTAYFLLKQMAVDGWVTISHEQAGNRPPRQVFRITLIGEQVFRELLEKNLSAHIPAYFNDDIGLAFLDVLEPLLSLTLLEKRRQALLAALEKANQIPGHPGSLQWVVDHQRYHLQSELDWLEHVMERLAAR